ncbi:hypothetical protein M422DRAFT_779860 [Sphaerobolus stellatus SS14]|uniref:Uncharacterized protein n=1 Tax=Sphaerobolus stellatus (strain SS14) TaxID=990650 RepID=A0A0C9VXK0_SPHS4|nr:hypothetical protein M422DRAFT_779860 [Sphaerobolus stellatus SS14]
MVAADPLFSGSWSLYKFRATVLNDIWPETALFTLIAAMVTTVTMLTKHDLGVSNTVLTVLGTVLGLVISFRTSSAYERYQEGRKLWSSISIASRNIGQLIWVHVPVERIKPNDPIANDAEKVRAERIKAVVEKRSMINLVQAFAVSIKHYLRSEPGIYYEDLYPLVSFLPRHSTASDPTQHDVLPMWLEHEKLSQSARSSTTSLPSTGTSPRKNVVRSDSSYEKALPQVVSEVPLRPSRLPPATKFYDYFPFLRIFKPVWAVPRWFYRRLTGRKKIVDEEAGIRGWTGKIKTPPLIDCNVPLEITMFLHSYVAFVLRSGLAQPAVASALITNLSSFQDTVANLERVRNTPIPFAYQAHLRMSLWIYLAVLPFQVVSTMKWMTIPGTCFAAFMLLGFLEIGQEIENPFNYDENDLDMDSFCASITRELHEISAHPAPDPASYIFTHANQPFAPADCRHAEEIITDVAHEYYAPQRGMDSIKRTLLRSWKQVEEVTKDC